MRLLFPPVAPMVIKGIRRFSSDVETGNYDLSEQVNRTELKGPFKIAIAPRRRPIKAWQENGLFKISLSILLGL